MSQNYFTRSIPAGGAVMVSAPGKVLSVKTSTLPISVAMDGRDKHLIQSGTVLMGPFNALNFFNDNAVKVTVNFYTGENQVPFSPADSSASNAQTYLLGNMGIASGASGNLLKNGTTPTSVSVNSSGYMSIDNNNYLIPGTNNGHRRQLILIGVSSSSSVGLNVQDSNQCAVMTVAPGQQVVLSTDSDLFVSGANGTALATIGQIFLAQ